MCAPTSCRRVDIANVVVSSVRNPTLSLHFSLERAVQVVLLVSLVDQVIQFLDIFISGEIKSIVARQVHPVATSWNQTSQFRLHKH